MKKFCAVLLFMVFLFSMAGCNRISIGKDESATLRFRGIVTGDTTKLTQVLTQEEASKVREYLKSARLDGGIGGCPYDKDISIAFGDQVFAIATDSCNTVWLVGSDKYYVVPQEGFDYIKSLFVKYVGYFPAP